MKCNPLDLPVEILDQIVRFTIPDPNNLAYPASHPTTKTLLACLTVSRATSRTAKTLLYAHCLYINSPWRLNCLLRSFSDSKHPLPISCIQNLYLSPFSKDTIREREVIIQVTELFTLLGACLKRLVIDMPLRSHYPEEDITDKLRPLLRTGFEQLIHLEEFCSVRDELYLAYWDPTSSQQTHDAVVNDFMFEKWTKLRRLALYNQMLDDGFRAALSHMPNLETVVLSRPDYSLDPPLDDLVTRFEAHVKVILVDATDDLFQIGMWKCKLEGMDQSRCNTWFFELFVCEAEDPIPAVQEWSLQCMLDGSLWTVDD